MIGDLFCVMSHSQTQVAPCLDVIELVGEPAEVTDIVSVRVHEGVHVDAIDDRVLTRD